MDYKGFCGPSSQSQSILADDERTMNMYCERMESQAATTRMALYPFPGVELLVDTTSTAGRAHAENDGREFAVIGPNFIEFDEDAVPTFRGAMALDSNPATISFNGDGGGEVFITSGGNGYIFDLATAAFSKVAALDGKATQGAQLDGYFLALDANTGTFYSSELLDGTTWNTGTMFAQRNAAPDPWVAMTTLGRYIYLFGTQSSEVWYNQGTTPFPFAPHPSGLIQYGIAAAWSAKVAEASLVWLGRSAGGQGQILRNTGFSPEPIASYPVQYAINGYSIVADAYADSYTDSGHTFYVLSFPTADKTWVYDLQMQLWYERGTWTGVTSDFTQWRSRCHAFAFGEHRWLHATGTGLYRMNRTVQTDVDGLYIVRERTAPTLFDENKRLFYSSLELHLEPGLGLVTGQGEDPQVMMQFSSDGGKTWSSERWRSAGKIGQYGTRVRWDRLGQGRKRLYRVRMSDPIPWRIMGASLEVVGETRQRGAA